MCYTKKSFKNVLNGHLVIAMYLANKLRISLSKCLTFIQIIITIMNKNSLTMLYSYVKGIVFGTVWETEIKISSMQYTILGHVSRCMFYVFVGYLCYC